MAPPFTILVATLLLYAGAGIAQSLGTGSISGYVLSEEGHTLRASVTISFRSLLTAIVSVINGR
jgi:hypothetical protein